MGTGKVEMKVSRTERQVLQCGLEVVLSSHLGIISYISDLLLFMLLVSLGHGLARNPLILYFMTHC